MNIISQGHLDLLGIKKGMVVLAAGFCVFYELLKTVDINLLCLDQSHTSDRDQLLSKHLLGIIHQYSPPPPRTHSTHRNIEPILD